MAKANPIRFSTKYQDEESDLLYYGYRYYNAGTGRWLGRDPMAELGGFNLYRFLDNDAVLAVDYLGLRSVQSIQCVVGVKEDGLSGPKTAAAIRAFQQLLILAGCLKEGGADGYRDNWNQPYRYEVLRGGQGFVILSYGPDKRPDTEDDIEYRRE